MRKISNNNVCQTHTRLRIYLTNLITHRLELVYTYIDKVIFTVFQSDLEYLNFLEFRMDVSSLLEFATP